MGVKNTWNWTGKSSLCKDAQQSLLTEDQFAYSYLKFKNATLDSRPPLCAVLEEQKTASSKIRQNKSYTSGDAAMVQS